MAQNVVEDGASSCPDNITTKHLCKMSELRTIPEIMTEKGPKTTKLMLNLTNVIQVKNRRLEDMSNKYMETRETITKLIAENDKLHQSYSEEMKSMKFSIREHFQWTCNDYEMINLELERQEKELQLRSDELQMREAVIENKRKKLAKEIEENSTKNRLLHEQRKANKNMMKLADDHKREKENLQKKIIALEKQLVAKQYLETELRKLNVYREIENKRSNLKEKEEELEWLEDLRLALIVRERKTNDEFHGARKELIDGFKELPKNRHIIGVKRMGELENKPFYDAMKQMYNESEAKNRASEVCSLWENYLRDPSWNPFIVTVVNGKSKEIIDENDEKLKSLKRDMGEKVYKAVITALTEIADYNPSGRYVIPELWNFIEGRKATLGEGVSFLLKMWNIAQKRRRIT